MYVTRSPSARFSARFVRDLTQMIPLSQSTESAFSQVPTEFWDKILQLRIGQRYAAQSSVPLNEGLPDVSLYL